MSVSGGGEVTEVRGGGFCGAPWRSEREDDCEGRVGCTKVWAT